MNLFGHTSIRNDFIIGYLEYFFSAITDAMSCFPQNLGCIVRRLYTVLVDHRKLDREQVSVIYSSYNSFYNFCESSVIYLIYSFTFILIYSLGNQYPIS